MTFKFNVTGEQRKELVKAISEYYKQPKKYLGMPSQAYTVDLLRIEKDGTVNAPNLNATTFEYFLEAMATHGFIGETLEAPEAADAQAAAGEQDTELTDAAEPRTYKAELSDPDCPDRMEVFSAEDDEDALRQAYEYTDGKVRLLELAELDADYNAIRDVEILPRNAATEPEAEPTAIQDGDKLTIAVSGENLSDVAFQNLENLIASKGELMKKALGITDLTIERTDDTVTFPWFSADAPPENIKAYTQFILALCNMAKELKRVSAKECDTDNDKISFRVFLIRMNMKGDEYAAARKILLSKLTGNGSFRYGEPAERRPKQRKPGKKGAYNCMTEFVKRLTAAVDSIITDGLASAPQDGKRWEFPYDDMYRYGVESGEIKLVTEMMKERPEVEDMEVTDNELYITFKTEYRPYAEDVGPYSAGQNTADTTEGA